MQVCFLTIKSNKGMNHRAHYFLSNCSRCARACLRSKSSRSSHNHSTSLCSQGFFPFIPVLLGLVRAVLTPLILIQAALILALEVDSFAIVQHSFERVFDCFELLMSAFPGILQFFLCADFQQLPFPLMSFFLVNECWISCSNLVHELASPSIIFIDLLLGFSKIVIFVRSSMISYLHVLDLPITLVHFHLQFSQHIISTAMTSSPSLSQISVNLTAQS
jgi:hypothetical protein